MRRGLLAFLLVACALLVGCTSPFDRTFAEAKQYWLNLPSRGHIDAAVLASYVETFGETGGLGYLKRKLTCGNVEDEQVAVVLFVVISEVLADHASPEAERMRDAIKNSAFKQKLAAYKDKAATPTMGAVMRDWRGLAGSGDMESAPAE